MINFGEKCAVAFEVNTNGSPAATDLERMLFAQQHRGTEGSGIVSYSQASGIDEHRGSGYVRDIFNEEELLRLEGSIAVGHNRYSTSGSKTKHLQPVIDSPLGFAFAHNGNLPVTSYLERELSLNGFDTRHLNDSEMMGHAIAQRIRGGHDLPEAVELTYGLFRGAFSCVAMHDGVVVAFRDPKGIRPLALGKTEQAVAGSSETCGLDIIGAEYIREVNPGEMAIIDSEGKIESRYLSSDPESKLDIFEFVYFSRHDSRLYGLSVNEIRRQFGRKLAEEWAPKIEDGDNILVVPVPDTSIPAAEGYAEALGLSHNQAIIKNRYTGRSFIEPSQGDRKSLLRVKHTMVPERVQGRDLIIIDDSVVRMNTLPRLVELAYSIGAKSVTCLVASPPVRFPDFYGIDTPSQDELAAANMKISQMRKQIGCVELGYLSLGGMIEATGLEADMFNLSCFNGEYPIGIGHHKKNIRKPVSMKFAS